MATAAGTLVSEKPHAVFLAFPAQSHIKAMMKLAKLLHCKGFHITFVNTEFNHRRYLKNAEPHSLVGLPDFQFESIPDGLPPSDADTTQDMVTLVQSLQKNCSVHFLSLLRKLNSRVSTHPPATCIVSDGFMPFVGDANKELRIPIVVFWPISANSFMGMYQLRKLIEKGVLPLKDASYLTNGYMDTVLDWIPGMRNMRLKDFPTFEPTMDPNEPILQFGMEAAQKASEALANVIHTYDELEQPVLNALSSIFPCHFLAVGPLQLLLKQIPEKEEEVLNTIGYNLWKEEPECLQWLKTKKPNSVVYVNFGSIATITPQKLVELSWGLAKSDQQFLWIIRPDLVEGESAVLPPEFLLETKERGMLAGWCPQEEVLNHPSVGGFLTHSGWNSTMESLSAGVPMICVPFFGDQRTNCRYSCTEWGIGMEMNHDWNRDEVEILVREMMNGEKGKEMKRRVIGWKKLAEEATRPDGSSSLNLDKMAKLLLASRN